MGFISIMEWIGTVAFAISGAMVAIEKKMDYYGISVLALATAIGGGIVRDVLINRDLPASLENPIYVMISLVTVLIVILFYGKAKNINGIYNIINIADAFGLAAFVAVGAEVAVTQSKGTLFVIITLAVLTGTGGGIIRDIFAQKIPVCFHKEVYASAAIIGAIVYYLVYGKAGITAAAYLSFGVTLLIRLVAIKHGLDLGKVTVEDFDDVDIEEEDD